MKATVIQRDAPARIGLRGFAGQHAGAPFAPASLGGQAVPLPHGRAGWHERMLSLHHRLTAALDGLAQPVIQFAGCSGGEGVSSIAEAYAGAVGAWLEAPVLLLSGRTQPPPATDLMEVWRRPDWEQVLRPGGHAGQLRGRFSAVVIDSPPLLAEGAAQTLAALADGTALVLQAERTRAEEARAALASIERGGGRVLGVLLNRQRRHLPAWLDRRV